MKIFKDKHTLQREILKTKGISFVPTMGALHKGHISLIKKSKKSRLKTLVSIFVNPKQFHKKRDFRTYPRKKAQDIKLLKSTYMNDGNNGTDDTSPTFKSFEEGSETMSKEANTQLALRQEKFIRDLKNALIRIENKTYGVCRVTGKLINKKRLKIVPHATLSIEAKNIQS